jgi:hypothetical protein
VPRLDVEAPALGAAAAPAAAAPAADAPIAAAPAAVPGGVPADGTDRLVPALPAGFGDGPERLCVEPLVPLPAGIDRRDRLLTVCLQRTTVA